MVTVIDSSLWVDHFRRSTADAVKAQVLPHLNSPDATVCEPILFELMRAASAQDRRRIAALMDTLPVLPTPLNLWASALELGARCADEGIRPYPMDILIAAICLHHGAALVTFDAHFADIARVTPLKVRVLARLAQAQCPSLNFHENRSFN